jgi:hypothetical protein
MALVKIIRVGSEMKLDISNVSPEAKKEISVFVVEKAGRSVILKITADPSIPIRFFEQKTLP